MSPQESVLEENNTRPQIIFEPLLNPENNRLTIYPIRYPKIWEQYKIQSAAIWFSEEIDMSGDANDFLLLTDNEQYFIKMVLSFFSASDVIVNINLGERFAKEVQLREAIVCYNFQMMMENIHSEVYSLMIDNIIKDSIEKGKLFNAITEFPCISKKANWAQMWTEDTTSSFAQRLIAFAIVEGVFFSGSFCAIFWLKKKGIMNGLCDSNELIARDEGLHVGFALLLYSMIVERVPEEIVKRMFEDAVEIEREFICDSLPCSLLGMNKELMYQYIKFVADRLLESLNYTKIYNVTNPFDFMESISMEGKTNFFEHRPSQYQKASILNETVNNTFEILEVF